MVFTLTIFDVLDLFCWCRNVRLSVRGNPGYVASVLAATVATVRLKPISVQKCGHVSSYMLDVLHWLPLQKFGGEPVDSIIVVVCSLRWASIWRIFV